MASWTTSDQQNGGSSTTNFFNLQNMSPVEQQTIEHRSERPLMAAVVLPMVHIYDWMLEEHPPINLDF